ncbi:GGDEF domain-containing protein [Catellatospora sp. NPDC049133]|jgi:diguanylate cyclase (GGDEF)-like protein|uniref:GGDEF domain-containing protein n=1 Tax=Catellatospora sp. NPDC049133 TaxID=3155499 RepID=UPI0033CF95C9
MSTTLSALTLATLAAGTALIICRLTGSRLRRRLLARLWHAVHVDALTGLPNRAGALDELGRRYADHRPLSLGFADLDQFKAINDTHGHEVGDRALQHIALVLRTHLPDTFAARIHGDEFVFAWHALLTDALAHAWHVRHLVSAHPLRLPDGELIELRMSIGVAERSLTGDLRLLMHHADLAMHDAKASDSGCAPYNPQHHVSAVTPRPGLRARERRHAPTPLGSQASNHTTPNTG